MNVFYKKPFLSLQYKVIYFVIVVIILFTLVLLRTVEQRYSEFHNYHNTIAQTSTKKISHKLNDIIINKRRLVTSFYEDNMQLVQLIIENPQDREYYEELNDKLGRYFSDYFATNILNEKSELIVDEFEGNIGEICLADVRRFKYDNKQSIRIHPNHNIFHYDILIDIKIKGKKYIFLVSFDIDEMASLLQVSHNQFHTLIIVNTRVKDLIAITTEGSRDNLTNRKDIYISKEESLNILSSQKIQGTQWKILDINKKDLFATFQRELYEEELIVLLIFLLITFVMSTTIISSLREKERLANSLIQKNETINVLNEELKNLAVRDALTGLYNRRYYDETSLLKYREAKRLGLVYNVAILDIDFFKPYNDNYGHIKGDECLCRVAACISNKFKRSNEFSARYGGEEFVIVNIGDEKEIFTSRLNALLLFLKKEAINHEFSDVDPHVTLSAGCSSSKDSKLISAQEQLQAADKNLYLAKENGRNKVVS